MKKAKATIELTPEQYQLLSYNGHIVIMDYAQYLHLPQWFKSTEKPFVYEVLFENQLPENVAKLIQSVKIKNALERLVHLHSCEQEGLASGQPTAQEWLEAVQEAADVLYNTNHEI